MDFIEIMGVKVNKITVEETVRCLNKFLEEAKAHAIYTPNTEMVMAAKKDEQLKEILNKSDLTIPDGIGLVYASRVKGNPLAERVTGYDISIKLLEIANDKSYSIYLLGGKEGVAKEAKEKINKIYPKLRIVGYHNGYFKGFHVGYNNHEEENQIIKEINESKPDILFVGLGASKQEKWISANKDKLNCRVIIGNGGTIDVLAGKVKRAPEIFQRFGLEWFYRLIKEPKRIKRQIVLPIFMLNVIFSRRDKK